MIMLPPCLYCHGEAYYGYLRLLWFYLLWLQEWLQLLLTQLAAVASGEYTPLALRHGDWRLLRVSTATPTTMAIYHLLHAVCDAIMALLTSEDCNPFTTMVTSLAVADLFWLYALTR